MVFAFTGGPFPPLTCMPFPHTPAEKTNGTDHFLHCTMRWCMVVWCHPPQIGHSTRCFCQGAPHPSHRALPHSHVTHAMRHVPFKGNQDTQCIPWNSGVDRCLMTHNPRNVTFLTIKTVVRKIHKNDGQTGSCAWTRQCLDRGGGGVGKWKLDKRGTTLGDFWPTFVFLNTCKL